MAVSKGSKTYNIIVSSVYIVLGVLLCIAMINVNQILSIMIGVTLIVGGVALFALDIYKYKELLPITIMTSTFLLGFGIGILIAPFDFTYYLSMLILVGGALMIVEGIIWLIKHRNIFTTVGIIVIGAVAITFGICFLCIADFRQFCSLVLGIVLIFLGVINLIAALLSKPKK